MPNLLSEFVMKHLRDNNETYCSHFKFASAIGLMLVFRGVIFLLHAVLPVCAIPKRWNLEDMIVNLKRANDVTEGRTK